MDCSAINMIDLQFLNQSYRTSKNTKRPQYASNRPTRYYLL